MTTLYSPLFRIDFRHDYFPKGNCPVIQLIPTNHTVGEMRSLGIRLKENQFGMEAFYNDGPPPAGQLLLADQPVRLSFLLRTTDTLFYNYTDLDLIGDQQTQYFSNLEGETSFKPSPDHLVSFGEEDGATAPANWQAGDLGIFEVYVGNTESNGAHILVDGTVTSATYTIEFPVRSTTWRYHLIDQNEPGHKDFQLTDPTSGETMASTGTPPASRMLPDGSKAILLPYPTKIPLQQRPGLRFTLSMKPRGGGRDTPVTLPLPSPDASRISREDAGGEGGPSFYSDIYVYL